MKTVKIKDLGRTVTGHTPPTSESKYFGDYMPFVKPTDIDKESKYTYNPEQYYSEEAAEKYKTSLIPKGATCVVCIGTIGEKMTMAHCDLYTNQSINSIIPSKDNDPDYVYYLLKYNLGKVKALNKGTASGREFVSKSTFLEMDVEVHEDLATQQKIGAMLSAYDSLIENYQKQIKLLEEAAQRYYVRWFVEHYVPSELSADFTQWKESSLGDLAKFVRGKTITKDAVAQNGTVPVVAGGLQPAYYHNVANAKAPVITVSGSGANAGYTNIYFEDIWASDCSFLDSQASPFLSFILCFLRDNKATIDNLQKGAAQPHVYAKDINALPMAIPPLEVLRAFESLVAPYFNKIAGLSKSKKLLLSSRDMMLQKVFSGTLCF